MYRIILSFKIWNRAAAIFSLSVGFLTLNGIRNKHVLWSWTSSGFLKSFTARPQLCLGSDLDGHPTVSIPVPTPKEDPYFMRLDCDYWIRRRNVKDRDQKQKCPVMDVWWYIRNCRLSGKVNIAINQWLSKESRRKWIRPDPKARRGGAQFSKPTI